MPHPLRAPIALLLLGTLASCQADPGDKTGDTAGACTGPSLTTVSEDQSLTLGSMASVEAEGKVCEGDVSYAWTVESVPVDSQIGTDDLNVSEPPTATFTPDVVGTYVVSVSAEDATGTRSAAEFVVVTVTSGNAAPVADCGANLTGEEDQRVDFDGTGSQDPEGASLTYQWTLSAVPDCSTLTPGGNDIFNGNSASPSLVPDCSGVFMVGLAVSDGEQWSEPDFCTVTVTSGNQAPIADAGDSTTLSACTEQNYELDGFGSYDPEGSALTYQWSLLSAPSGSAASDTSFNDATLANPTFRWDVAGAYTFGLQVSDGELSSSPDVVTYTFVEETENHAPVANAGDDVTIDATTECSTASYVFTCDDCEAEEIDLDGSASDDPRDGDDLGFLWSESTGDLTIASRYSAVTTATTPSFPSEYDVTTTRTWSVDLTVSDCADSDTDSLTVTYTCTGEYSP